MDHRENLTLGEPIKLRLNAEKHQNYALAAMERGLPLSTYLRQRLESGDRLHEQLADLRQTIARVVAPIEPAVMLETLLLLRTMVSPQQARTVQATVSSLGYRPWAPEGDSTTGGHR